KQRLMKKLFLILIGLACTTVAGAQQIYTLQNGKMRAEIDLNTGALVGMQNEATGWKLMKDASAGRAFEANIKLGDGQFYVINESSQVRPEVKIDNDALTFSWNKLKVGDKTVDIAFEGTIRMTDEGLVYDGCLNNPTDAIVEQLTWPFVGEVSIPEDTQRMLFQYFTYTKFNTDELYPRETGMGWSNLPEHAFTLIHNTKQGLYVSSMDHKLDEYIRCIYEILPTAEYAATAGAADSKQASGERNQMRTQIKAARMLYVQPHSTEELVPVIITPYTGTWHKGADIYKAWRKTWFVEPHRGAWLDKVSAWQQLQINSSESRINFKIKDLPKYVAEAKRYGVDAIQLTGWTMGGQDRGLPVHSLDPRLGTEAEFKKVIADAQKIGVKILLFTKFTWADLTTEYHEKYLPHRAINSSMDPYVHPGYNYNTYTQLVGVNTRRFSIHCMMDDVLRGMIRTEFQKCLDLGAAGMVYDENQHHAGAMLCFDPNHGHKVPGFNYQGADKLGREFYEMCQKSNPDFLMVGEGCYDLQSQYYGTYTRADYGHEPVLRYVDSNIPIACAVIDHNDLNHVNMCLADRYSMSYEVRNFKGSLSEFPRVMAYGRKVDDLRKRYSDFLWNGEFLDVLGATVNGDNIRYTVFRNQKTGKKAIVAYNVATDKANEATISIDGSSSPLVVVTPEKQSPAKFAGKISIGPQSVVVVMEK
ncbi:MAG: DUF6259 domain-containing protein, partial [Alistipes sp.]